MTGQEAFDTVARHLAAQGYRAMGEVDGDEFCRYRAPDGTTCGIGCLLKDEDYNPSMESKTIEHLTWLPDYLREAGIPLLTDLQCVHDCEEAWYPREMPSRLRALAADYGLNAAIVDRLDFSLIMPNPLYRG